MKKYKNILNISINSGIVFSFFSLLFFSIFMNYAVPLKIEHFEDNNLILGVNENIQEGYHHDFFMYANDEIPVQNSSSLDNINSHNLLLNDFNDNINKNHKLTKPVSSDYSVKFDLTRSARKFFIRQLIAKSKFPTERALRSDILLI